MKTIKYLFLGLLFTTSTLYAQTNIKLEIKHMQGAKSFALNQNSKTNLEEDYNAYRLEYYMAEISLEHDNGMITEIDSFWILVDVKGGSIFDLGQFNITDLEAIHFSIGVEQPFNHNDPSLWSTGHPLAPRSPSMHWGWSAGYRFFAMEGKCGSTTSYIYEFHSLGDDYYYQQRIPTAGNDVGGDLVITLNADYDRVLDDILLGTGKIEHGDFPLNIKTLQNVRDHVFTSSEGYGNSLTNPTTGIAKSEAQSVLNIYPNPSANGLINIVAPDANFSNSTLKILNQSGSIVLKENISNWTGAYSFELKNPGYYILNISDSKGAGQNWPVIVTQ